MNEARLERGILEELIAGSICGFARAITGVRAVWRGCAPEARLRIYYANHNSHGDFVLIWSSLPPALRARTRPVAGADYWLNGSLRRFIIERVFRGVLVERSPGGGHGHAAIERMGAALRAGDSLILFPEGTRNPGDALLPFRSGIFHLARAHPDVELVPVWIENLGRVMPKGSVVPVPLLCTLCFGPPLPRVDAEGKEDFLARARAGLLSLAPPAD